MPVTKITSKERRLSAPMQYCPTRGQGYFTERGQALHWQDQLWNTIQNHSIHFAHLVLSVEKTHKK